MNIVYSQQKKIPFSDCDRNNHLHLSAYLAWAAEIAGDAAEEAAAREARRQQNRERKATIQAEDAELEAALAAGDVELAQATYKAATKKIDQAASRGIIHKNAAAHKKSQFTKKLNAMGK